MKTRYVLGLAAVGLLAALSTTFAATMSDKAGSGAAASRHGDFVDALSAAGPHASIGDQATVLRTLVGSWDVNYLDILKDGREMRRTGELIVAWVLDGRAIEDVWIVDPSGERREREVYADLRYFDAKSRSWPTVFIDPEHGSMARFAGGATPDGSLVHQSSELGHPQNRWSFIDIGPDSCVFRDEYSVDGGVSWTLEAEYHMQRRTAVVSH